MTGWDATRVKVCSNRSILLCNAISVISMYKAQLRLTAQRLGLLQDKLEAQAHVTRKDIDILLQQGNVSIARTKTQKLMREDILSDLYQTMEMHVGVILGHLGEFELRCVQFDCNSGHFMCVDFLSSSSHKISPIVVESASSIVYAAPHLECKGKHNRQERFSSVCDTHLTVSLQSYTWCGSNSFIVWVLTLSGSCRKARRSTFKHG